MLTNYKKNVFAKAIKSHRWALSTSIYDYVLKQWLFFLIYNFTFLKFFLCRKTV